MHRIVIVLLCITTIAVGCISIVTASDTAAGDNGQMCIPLGIITISAPESVEAQRSAVDFPHDLHFEFACAECHHQWAPGADQIQSCTTSGCHELEAPPEPDSGDDEILYYKSAYHKMCIGCHKEIKTTNKTIAMNMTGGEEQIKTTGPTGCILCHPK